MVEFFRFGLNTPRRAKARNQVADKSLYFYTRTCRKHLMVATSNTLCTITYHPITFVLAGMKRIGGHKTYPKTDDNPKSEARYVPNAQLPQLPQPPIFDDPTPEELSLPFLDAPEEAPGAYEATAPSAEKAAKMQQNVAHMNELRAEEPIFLKILLSLHHHAQLLTQCRCGKESRLRKVA
ncbi:hypothetical protein B0H14DRAFT_2568531 [Mycena olivaceomarginata]|nr:hypothetical protein B0H14DRAFT_2568531 [Mycena olivaceomarginata]